RRGRRRTHAVFDLACPSLCYKQPGHGCVEAASGPDGGFRRNTRVDAHLLRPWIPALQRHVRCTPRPPELRPGSAATSVLRNHAADRTGGHHDAGDTPTRFDRFVLALYGAVLLADPDDGSHRHAHTTCVADRIVDRHPRRDDVLDSCGDLADL